MTRLVFIGSVLACILAVALLAPRCSKAPDGHALTNASPSAEHLVKRALTALHRNDPLALDSLRVTKYEHDSIMAPMMRDSAWVANFDLTLSWNLLNMSSQKGVLRAIEDYGGDSLTLISIRYREPDQDYGQLILHPRTAVMLKDEATGEISESWMFGSVLELNGQFKFVSIRD